MRHRKGRHQLNRRLRWRDATIKSLVQAILTHETIKTTIGRAKASQPLVEKLISWGRTNTLEKKRMAFAALGDHALVQRLFAVIAPRYKTRSSGFTRILRIDNRRGDDAQIALFQLTELAPIIKAQKSKKAHKEADVTEEAEVKTPETKAVKGEVAHEKKEVATEETQHPKKQGKPAKKFLGGIRGIFKKERDSL
jgi:large subunit ribosomal protein L17